MTLPAPPIGAVDAIQGQDLVFSVGARPASSFARMLFDGINQVEEKNKAADAMVRAFAIDDSIPPHRVLFALGEARHSLEILMQVRARLVEGYQEIMRMQL